MSELLICPVSTRVHCPREFGLKSFVKYLLNREAHFLAPSGSDAWVHVIDLGCPKCHLFVSLLIQNRY